MPDRLAVVTGAGGGIGGACAQRFAARGDLVVCVDLNPVRAHSMAAAITTQGGRARSVQADASTPGFGTTVAREVGELGKVVAVVHALAHEEHTPAQELSVDSVERSLRVGPMAAFSLFQSLFNAECFTAGTALTVIGSLHATRAFSCCLGYNAAHGALAQVVRSLAHEWARHAVRVNAVVPGWIRTGGEELLYGPERLDRSAAQLPTGRFGTPDDVASAVEFVSSPQAAYISGAFLSVDGALDVSLARLPGEAS